MTKPMHLAARCDGGGVTIVVGGPADRMPALVYWGMTLPPDEDIEALAAAQSMPVLHAGLDEPPAPSLFPEAGRGCLGTPALDAFEPVMSGSTNRRWVTQLEPRSVIGAGDRITVTGMDMAAMIKVVLILQMHASGVLAARTVLTNLGNRPLVVAWLAAPALAIPDNHATLVSWHGRWCAEFNRHSAAWAPGTRLLESRSGRTGHETFPGLVSLGPDAGYTSGDAIAASLAWSGSWRFLAESYAPGLRHLMAGQLFLPGEITVAPGSDLETPELLATRSGTGLAGVSERFHADVRNRLMKPPKLRPVHFNSWEALYFKLTVPGLKALADRAAAVGAERFVIDDGWFKGRIDDRRALGDWIVDRDKFPQGLGPVIDHVRSLGMGFGIWVEPEMVSAESDLYRAHPDWALGDPGHRQLEGRQQLVLDLAKPEVTEYVFGKLDALLTDYRIDYLKWDMNRVLTLPGRDGCPVAAAQVSALYDLFARLRMVHPETEIESCSSGGGRIDFGILRHVQRFWLSDNNDAHDRWRMNQEASVFLPPELFGHHVGPSPCHTSGRRLDMRFRAFSAAVGGHMGLELDLAALSADELETLAAAITFHKCWRSVLHQGRHQRLSIADPYVGASWNDGQRLLVAVTQRVTLPQGAPALVRVTGLEQASNWRLRFSPALPVDHGGVRGFRSPLAAPEGLVASASALAGAGFRLPGGWPDSLWLIEGERLS